MINPINQVTQIYAWSNKMHEANQSTAGLLLQLSPLWQMHKNVHLKEFCLQLHLLLEQGDWDLQPHFTNLIRAGGAMSVPSGVTTGNKKSNPSGVYHQYC